MMLIAYGFMRKAELSDVSAKAEDIKTDLGGF